MSKFNVGDKITCSAYAYPMEIVCNEPDFFGCIIVKDIRPDDGNFFYCYVKGDSCTLAPVEYKVTWKIPKVGDKVLCGSTAIPFTDLQDGRKCWVVVE